ncbi:MAG: hypothetical protein AAGF57_20710 [Pseudomonadota bacterium]
MESLFDQNMVARLILTVISIALCIGPAKADFNSTHATNPLWPGHARFHVVWQVVTNSSNSLILLALLWFPIVQYDLQLKLAVAFIAIILGSFYVTLACMRLFDGSLSDPNGIKPVKFKFPGRTVLVDTNLFGFSVLSILLVVGATNIAGA